MNRSHLDKLSESYAQIAEGKKSEEEVKDWNRKDDNPQGKKVDKKKVDKCTCESFYLKRLHAMNPVYAEQYRAIAEVLIGEGYESARLLDNIIEALPMDVVGPEFVSAMKAVNPRIHENLETAEKKQARAIVLEQIKLKSWDEWKRGIKNIPGNLQRAGQAVSDFINPPANKSSDPVVRQGGSYTGRSGTAVTPSSSSSGPTAEQQAEKLRQQRQETQDALRGTTGTAQTGERSAAANDARQQTAKAEAQAARTGGTGSGSTGSAYTPRVDSATGPSSSYTTPTRPTTNKDGSMVTRVGKNYAGQTPMQQWAKNFPDLAAKVKPGQSGYKQISAMKPKTVSASYQPEGEQLHEKPGDGYLGPTVKIGGKPYGIPNPIRIAQDVSDVVNTRNRATVSAANAHRSGSASMIGSTKSYNKDTSVASKTLLGLRHTPNAKEILKQNQSFEPEGEIIEGYVSVEDGVIYLEGNQGPSTPVRIYTFPDGSKRVQPYVGGGGAVPRKGLVKKETKPTTQTAGYEPEGEMIDENLLKNLRKFNPGARLAKEIGKAIAPPVADGTLKGKPGQKRTTSESTVFESLKQARKNVGASTCWDGYKAKGTKTKNGKEVPNCVKEGIRDEDAEKGTKERKERLEKKRGHSVDDHPQYKKDKKDDSYLETNMKKRQENNEKARKEMADKKDDTVPRWMKDDYDLYDVILTYLDENGIMESVEHAEEIMEQLTAEEILGIVEEFLYEADERPENRNSPAHRDRSNEGLSDRQIRMKQFADKRVQQANQRTADTQAARARSARTSRGSRGGRGGGGAFSSPDTATYGIGQFDPSRHGGV